MANAIIEITGIKSKDLLDLTNNGDAEVNSKDLYRKVKWKVKTEEVRSVRIESRSTEYPFKNDIPTDFRSKVMLKVQYKYPAMNWGYVIYWKDAKGNEHCHSPIAFRNPIIAIKSSKSIPGEAHKWSWKHWLGLGLGLVGLALWLSEEKKKVN